MRRRRGPVALATTFFLALTSAAGAALQFQCFSEMTVSTSSESIKVPEGIASLDLLNSMIHVGIDHGVIYGAEFPLP